MSRASVLARGRAFAAGGFIDTCRIERAVAEDTNNLTGVVTRQYAVVYTGPCRVQQAAAPWAGPAEVGQAAIRISALELQLPVVGSENLMADDRVTILTCVNDAELVDKRFVVVGLHYASHKTARRIPLEEIIS